MGVSECGGPYRIDGLLDLHGQYPGAVEASLIAHGLRWRDVGTPGFRWSDCIALLDNLPWDAPLRRAADDDWRWGNPIFEVLVTIAEATYNANVYRARGRKTRGSDLLKIPRPWGKEKSVEKLGGAPEPIADIDAWLDARIEGQRAQNNN